MSTDEYSHSPNSGKHQRIIHPSCASALTELSVSVKQVTRAVGGGGPNRTGSVAAVAQDTPHTHGQGVCVRLTL